MESIEILEELFDNKILKVLRHFIANQGQEFYLREIATLTHLSPATTYRILNKLVKNNILRFSELKNNKLYMLEENKTTEYLKSVLKLEKRIVDLFVDKVKNMEGLESIIMHGEEKNNKANLLLIGEGINPSEVKRLCAEIKEKYDFSITSLSLTREQFGQMSAMGLYSGKKKVLFEKR
ncbi:MAG: helix-turn-helix domain-containing protein [Nanoarchaeota archaeon]|nr:helix-turn-helix domain-containing protein [Nanoarchaeota archaeon]